MYKKTASSKRQMARTVKFSLSEINEIKRNAKEKGLSISAYIRSAALSGEMSEDYYEKKYLTRLVPITDGINKLQILLSSNEPNITEIRRIVYSMDKEITRLWQ